MESLAVRGHASREIPSLSPSEASDRRRTDGKSEALAASLDELNTVAQRHLDHKEQKIDPLAAATATQEKRNALNEHAAAEIQWTSGGTRQDRLLVVAIRPL